MKIFINVMITMIMLMTGYMSPILQDNSDSKLIVGGTYTLPSGEVLDGSLMIVGGAVVLEPGSVVAGDVLIIGGSLEIGGSVSQNVVALGGQVRLRDTAIIHGDLQVPVSNLDREPGAQVDGQVVQGGQLISPIVLPGGITIPNLQVNLHPFWYGFSFLAKLLQAFLWAALAALVVVLLPRHTERVARTLAAQPLLAGGLGLLTFLVAPILLVITAITLIGIPISLAGGMLLVISCAFGVIAAGTELGKRIETGLKQDWALAVSAALGTFIITLVLGFLSFVQCVGWIGWLVVSAIGLGAVVLSRYGTGYFQDKWLPQVATEPIISPSSPATPVPPAPDDHITP